MSEREYSSQSDTEKQIWEKVNRIKNMPEYGKVIAWLYPEMRENAFEEAREEKARLSKLPGLKNMELLKIMSIIKNFLKKMNSFA